MLFFYCIYPFLFLISILPFRLLYLFSDFLYLLVYYVLGYRKKIVQQNLKNSFPQKSKEELKKIEKAYYKHLTDLVLETVKGMTISEKSLRKRCKNIDRNVFEDLLQKNKNVVAVMSHNGNWEWVCDVADLTIPQQAMCIYKTLSNKYFDQWIYKIRSRFGTLPFPMEKTLRAMAEYNNKPAAIALVGDQNPSSTKSCHWTTFLNQDTAFLTGSERVAIKMNWAVVYLKMRKIKRGYYECFTEVLFENPGQTQPGEITEKIARTTEQDILEAPEYWLWSHRRWKHKRR